MREYIGLTDRSGDESVDAKDFWISLEWRVGSEIDCLRCADFRGLWCDGFIPEQFQVLDARPAITGIVWIAKSGNRGWQQRWRFTLLLPQDVRSEEDLKWADLLPPEDVTGWLSLDPLRQTVMVDPLAAYPDPRPQRGSGGSAHPHQQCNQE